MVFPSTSRTGETDRRHGRFSSAAGTGTRTRDRLSKGGNRPLKGGNRPLKERIARIEELEGDFDQLNEFKETNWMQFIKQGWSRILTTEEPDNLDLRYSGQQIARNLAA